MSPFFAHLGYEVRAGVRNPSQMMMSYLFPLGFFAMMGWLMPQLNPLFIDVLVPAMALFCMLAGALLGLPGAVVESRIAGVHRGLRIHGVPASALVGGPVLASTLHGAIAVAIVSLVGPLAFGGHAPAHWAWFALCVLAGGLAFASLGALIGVVSTGARATMLLTQVVFLPSMLLGGMMVPLSSLPPSLHPVAGLLPTTWAMLALQNLAYGEPTQVDGFTSLAVISGFGLCCFSLALLLFTADSRGGERRLPAAIAALCVLPLAAAATLLS